jgi:hypothetical protein
MTAVKTALNALRKHPEWYLFQIAAGQKFPPLTENMLNDGIRPPGATNDPAAVAKWDSAFNVGIAPNASRLVFMDVDTKPGKKGAATFKALVEKHGPLPKTLTVRTPSGGLHYWFYETPKVKHRFGRNAFGPDVDCPQYVLLPGSRADGGGYTVVDQSPIAPAPAWFAEYLIETVAAPGIGDNAAPAVELDTPENIERAIYYLKNDAKPSIEGSGGEKALLDVGAVVKDLGISEPLAVTLINENYNVDGKCIPIWPLDQLTAKVGNAYAYLKETQPGALGIKAAEDFAESPEPPSSPEILASIKEGERQQAAEQAAGKLTWANVKDGFVYVGQQKQFVRLKDGEFWEVDAFEKQFGYVRFGLQDATGNRPRSFTKFIFDLRPGEGLETFDSFAFSPGQPPRYNGKFNQWRPSLIAPKQGDTKLWDEHLAYLFADAAARNRVLDWMAWVYQNPTLHPNHSLVVFGKIQGTGKTLLPRVLSKLLSALPITPVSQHTLESDHQTWPLRTKLAVVEIRSANAKLTNLLHELITGDTVHVDMKGLHDFDLPNVVAYWIETNKPNAMEGLDDSDRRHMIETTDGKVPLRPKTKAYYRMLYPAVLDNPEALAAIAYALKTRDLKDYSGLDRAPSTAAKMAMLAHAAGDVDKWMIEHRDDIPLSYTVVGVDEIFDAMPSDIKHVKGARRRIPEVLLSSVFNGEELGQVRLGGPDDIRPRLYVIHKTRPDVSVRETFTDAELARIHWSERRTGAQALAEAKADFADPPD